MPDLAAISSHGHDHDHDHGLGHGHGHRHDHGHRHGHRHDQDHDHGLGLGLGLALGLGHEPPALPRSFFRRPAEVVAPDLIGCLLVRRQASGALLWGVIVETEAYTQDDPACHGHRRRSASNETLFGPPGYFYVYRCYGIHHCVNVVTDRAEWASGVLLRAAAIANAPERQAAGPGLLARSFDIDHRHDGNGVCGEGPLWLAPRPGPLQALLSPTPIAPSGDAPLRQDRRIGISAAVDQPWRWYLGPSRSVSRRAQGDRQPAAAAAWRPEHLDPGAQGAWLGGRGDRPLS